MTVAIDQDIPPLRVDGTGTVRVGTSRITLDHLVDCYRDGMTPEHNRDI